MDEAKKFFDGFNDSDDFNGSDGGRCSDTCPLAAGGSYAGYEIVSNPPELRAVLKDLFTDTYMKAHTNFESFAAFRYSSAVIVNWEQDPMIYSRQLLDNFVNESTSFSTFDEMVIHALACEP